MKNHYFYIDTTSTVHIGILDQDFNWVELKSLNNKKASRILHGEIDLLFNEHQLDFSSFKNIIYCSGPGSYTGLRLSQGLIQTLRWQGYSVAGFKLFEVPFFLGVQRGIFLSEAYKGEVFVHEWHGEKSSESLISAKDLSQIDFSLEHIYHPQGEIGDQFVFSIEALIRTKPQGIFPSVIEREEVHQPFYFRSVDKEFRLKGKSR